MKTVIVVESCFGNTRAVAEAIGEGLRSGGSAVDLIAAEGAPSRVTADLLVIAAPTHNAGMPKSKTRKQAAEQGATHVPAAGVREWIDRLDGVDARAVAVSTTTGGKYAGSAAKSMVKALKRRKIPAEHGADFRVDGTPGPLGAGELERARDWGQSLMSRRTA